MSRRFVVVALVLLTVSGIASAAQQSRWSPTKASSTDFSGDGLSWFNTTYGGAFRVNNTGVQFGNWSTTLVGNLTNASLSTNRTWTLPDLTGTLATLENSNTWGGTQSFTNGPAFTDYSSAQHDHADADDGGTLPAGAITSGTVARARLPAELAYEDEPNVYLVRQSFLDGASFALGYVYANHHVQVNSSFLAAATAWFNGAVTVNSSLSATGTLTSKSGAAGQILLTDNGGAPNIEFGSAQDTSLGRCSLNLICTGALDALDVAGTTIASTNAYFEGPARFNTTSTFVGRPTFTANALSSGTAPDYFWQETDAATDGGLWSIQAQGGTLNGRAVNDVESAANNWLVVTRSGATVGTLYLVPNSQVNGTLTAIGAAGVGASPPSTDGKLYIQHNTASNPGALLYLDNTRTGSTNENFMTLKRNGVVTGSFYGDGGTQLKWTGGFEIDGALDHDGSTVGLYGVSPTTRQAITDNMGGTASATCNAVVAGTLYSQTDMQRVRDCISQLIVILETIGIAS